jgi:hypothetical protein
MIHSRLEPAREATGLTPRASRKRHDLRPHRSVRDVFERLREIVPWRLWQVLCGYDRMHCQSLTVLRSGLLGGDSARKHGRCCTCCCTNQAAIGPEFENWLLRAPLRNRTVDLLLTMHAASV